ncbi:MAG: hypothetical protein J6S14_11670 [Clostridia bacterium]|nr:hypothetical protein [Clostridia bacterium]
MARYIDADKLKKLRDDVISGKLDVKTESDLIDRCPAKDVVEVVRCRDCKWCVTENLHGEVEHGCDFCFGLTVVEPDSFCSYGEKERLAEE